MKILQVSTSDIAGGAESVAWRLFEAYRHLGHGSWLAVGLKRSRDPDVLSLAHRKPENLWYHLCKKTSAQLRPVRGKSRGMHKAHQLLENLSEPMHWLQRELGIEDFDSPGSWRLLDLTPEKPDVVHLHNLHGPPATGGAHFDLRVLPWLSQQVPVVLTLHDAWLLSGHCAHSFDCIRWRTGCGHCPDLTIYPAIRRDATAYNWRRKRKIYAGSRLYVATPSRWLMRKVEESILAPAVVEPRIIPNGVDLSVFHPADRQAIRSALGIHQEASTLLFTANYIRSNIWKDYETLRAAVSQVAGGLHGHGVLVIALGEDAPAERIGQAEVRFVPFQGDPDVVARYYQAADVYVHAARADTFPLTVLEALACGTPVVATAVGGIPEQVEDMKTGFLVASGDAQALASRIVQLLSDNTLRQRMGANAAEAASRRFDLRQQIRTYLEWYQEILVSLQHRVRTSGPPATG